ncbi:MAG: ATP-dependent helicase [Anaerolineaceae bacterium]
MFNPRPMQAEILKYPSGLMGVSAVPGSGKTHTLSRLAAQLIMDANLNDDQEILIVTLVNSAVNNFSTRIASFINEQGLLPGIGYRVRTLHGLAHDIVRERPEIAGLSERFTIIDESEADRMIEEISAAYLRSHPELEAEFIVADLFPLDSRTRLQWNNLITSLNANFISQAKDWQLDPETILERLEKYQYSDPLMSMVIDTYTQYQRGLRFRNAVDFSDLVRLAYRVLDSDPGYLSQLQYRWPYILEDEAQDSSQIQEQILRIIVKKDGNWVRVGDPNQAIYETFTTASPKFLKDFLIEPGVTRRDLANSGRSNISIINLANSLISWTMNDHPVEELQDSLTTPFILPTDPGDPQPNPPDSPNSIFISTSRMSPETEISRVVESICKWLPEHPNKTVAVLSPIGAHGEKIVAALQESGINVVEMLKSSESTRTTCRILEKILVYLADPSSQLKLATAFFEIYRHKCTSATETTMYESLQASIKSCKQLEEFLYPQPEEDWLELVLRPGLGDESTEILRQFRDLVRNWHQATLLPIDQLILTLAQELFTTPQELALAHKIALLLEFSARIHPEFQLADFSIELADIASNRRKFLGFSDDENGFNPEDHKGEVFVSTYHKAKGLEWDRVYLLSVNNYDFPSAQEFDQFTGEKWFIQGQVNLEAACLARLKALYKFDQTGLFVESSDATQNSRLSYASERLRLLYVGITRARDNLIITWNTGKQDKSQMALSLASLHAILEKKNEAA